MLKSKSLSNLKINKQLYNPFLFIQPLHKTTHQTILSLLLLLPPLLLIPLLQLQAETFLAFSPLFLDQFYHNHHMKKLCRSRGTVHPSPPTVTDHLSFLPAYLITLAASLSPADLEVLAYLITANNADGGATPAPHSRKGSRKNPSSAAKQGVKGRAAGSCSVFGGGGSKSGDDGDHDPNFCCDCFRCYMSYWVRWDKSPNRQLIDEIIDAYEAGLASERSSNGGNNGRGGRGRKDRRKARGSEAAAAGAGAVAAESPAGLLGGEQKDTETEDLNRDDDRNEAGSDSGGDEADKGSSVRKLVSFIGERIWGVWN